FPRRGQGEVLSTGKNPPLAPPLSREGEPSGILADFGASLYQFTSPERGFSFALEGPLDMRMDQSEAETAADIVNASSQSDLIRILREYGEEREAVRIARAIVEERQREPIESTSRLAALIESVIPRRRDQKIHPAT